MVHPHKPYWLWCGGRAFTLCALALAAMVLNDAWTAPQRQNTPKRGLRRGETMQARLVDRRIEFGDKRSSQARNRRHVFISFKHEDLDFAENVSGRLESAGFATWADSDINAGQKWQDAIDTAIEEAFALIVIMTPEAKASEYVTFEWAFALGTGIRIVPLLLRPTQLHPRLEALQYLDFTNMRSRPWERLIEDIKAASHAEPGYSPRIPDKSSPPIRGAEIRSIKDPTTVPELIVALKDQERTVRASAAKALGGIEDPAVVPALIEALNDKYEQVLRAVASALGACRSQAAVPALIEKLMDPGEHVRISAARALGDIGHPAAVLKLIDALDDPVNEVRSIAAKALGAIKDPGAVPALIKALSNGAATPSNLSAIAEALEQIDDPAAAPALTEALQSARGKVRSAATRALRSLNRQGTMRP